MNKKQFFSRFGNLLEWYDFSLFGYTAPIFAAKFFGHLHGFLSVVITFATFAIGFLCRPIGGFILGAVADRYGCAKAINISIYLMMIVSILMGLLPTASAVGLWAAVLLILLRMVQGFSTGGQFTSSLVYSVENTSHFKRGRMASFIWQGGTIGFLCGSVMSTIAAHLTGDYYMTYGWRIPYLISIILLVAYYYFSNHNSIKNSIDDSNLVTHHQSIAEILLIIRQNLAIFIKVLLLVIFAGVIYYILLSYMITYMHVTAGLPVKQAILINTICLLVQLINIPLFGRLSDKIGRKPLMLFGIISIGVFSYFAFTLILKGKFLLSLIVLLLMLVCGSAYIGSVLAVFVELFPKEVRCTASSLSYDIAMGFFGGTAPAIAAWLQYTTKNHLAPVFYIIFTAILALLVTLTIKSKHTRPAY